MSRAYCVVGAVFRASSPPTGCVPRSAPTPRSPSSIRPTGSGHPAHRDAGRPGDGHRAEAFVVRRPRCRRCSPSSGWAACRSAPPGCARPSTPGPHSSVAARHRQRRPQLGAVGHRIGRRRDDRPDRRRARPADVVAARCRSGGRRGGRRPVRRAGGGPLGGPDAGRVYAGSAATIGIRAAVPTVAAALDAGATSLTEACRRALPGRHPRPGVRSHRGGYRVLLDELVRRSGLRWVQTAVRHIAADGPGGCCATTRARRGARMR